MVCNIVLDIFFNYALYISAFGEQSLDVAKVVVEPALSWSLPMTKLRRDHCENLVPLLNDVLCTSFILFLCVIKICFKIHSCLVFSFLKNWLCPGSWKLSCIWDVESYIFYICILSYVFDMYSTVSRIWASCKKWPWFRHFAINACLAPLYSVEGMHIITVEGLGDSRRGLHPVQVIQLLCDLLISSKNGS
jgi:hypothetical protein